MLSITAYINALLANDVRALPKKQFLEVASSNLDNNFDEEIVPAFERGVRKVMPGYKPLSEQEKQERKSLHELATTSVGPAMYDLVTCMNNVPELGSFDRSLQSIFYGIGNTEKEIEQKKEMSRILKEGTAEERHDLFLETMDRMAGFPMAEFRAATPADKLRNMGRYMPMLQLGLEGENILKLFQDMNCGITEEEGKQFTTMFAELNATGMALTQELEMMLNPYYASVDCTKLPLGAEDINALEEATFDEDIPNDHVIHQLRESSERVVANQLTPYRTKVSDTFKAAGLATDMKDVYLCTAEGKVLHKDEGNRKDLQWIREGKTVYYTSRKDANKEVMAFRDLAGNGILTRVPPEVKKPNGFVMFFDNINRALGGKGFKSVNKYNEYTQRISELTAEARTKSINDDYNDAAEKVHTKAEERRQQKAAAKVQVRQSTVEEKTVAEQEEVDYELATEEEREYWRIARQIEEKDPYRDTLTAEEMKWQIADFQREQRGEPVPRKVRPKKAGFEASKENYIALSPDTAGQAELTDGELSQEIPDTAPKSVINNPGTVEKPKPVEEHKNTTVYSGGDEEPDEPSAPAKDERNSKELEADRERAISYVYNDIDSEKTGNMAARTMDEDAWREEHRELMESVREEAQKRYDEHIKELSEQSKLPNVDEQPAEKPKMTQGELDAENRKRAFDIVYSSIKAQAEGRELRRNFDEEDWCNDHKDLMESVREEAQKKYNDEARYAKVKESIDKQAKERSELLRKGKNFAADCYDRKGKMTIEERDWAKANPAAARDGFQILKKHFLTKVKPPYSENQQKQIKFFNIMIGTYEKEAAAQNDPVELAHQGFRKAPEADRVKSAEIAGNMLRNGKLTPEEAKWTAAHPETVRDALTLVKHDYTIKHDNQPHDEKYYQSLINLDRFAKDLTGMIKEKSKQSAQAVQSNAAARKSSAPKAVI